MLVSGSTDVPSIHIVKCFGLVSRLVGTACCEACLGARSLIPYLSHITCGHHSWPGIVTMLETSLQAIKPRNPGPR